MAGIKKGIRHESFANSSPWDMSAQMEGTRLIHTIVEDRKWPGVLLSDRDMKWYVKGSTTSDSPVNFAR